MSIYGTLSTTTFMDDTLEIPRPRAEVFQEGDDHSSGDEDGGLDWTKLP